MRTRIVQHLTRRDGRHVYPTLKSQYDPMFIKIAKGLHYHEFGVPAGPEYQAWARLEPSDRGNAYRNAANVVTRGLTPSFNFSVLGDSDVSIWWLEFAAGPVVLATLQKPSWRADDGHAKLALARIR